MPLPELSRRALLVSGGAALAMPRVALAAPGRVPGKLPPAIGRAERMQRLAKARALMEAHHIGAIIVEPGASLDYFTGVQWWRSERLTAAVIPVRGEPLIVTPFFEKPSVEESLGIPAEVRVWQEDEDPFALVAGFLAERRLTREPIGLEESVRHFVTAGLWRNLPGARVTSANPVVRGCRMIKSPAEIALMTAASDITIAAFRQAVPRIRQGMTRADIDSMITEVTRSLGGEADGGLVLIGEASAYPHGSHKPQVVERGSVVLLDCGCSVHGYQSDISRTLVWGADPTPAQRKVWDQVHRGQQIAFAAARIGAPAGSVDDAVRHAYESWGYGPRYTLPGLPHRTGHGIGMEGHEPVNLVHGETTPLAPGMCFSDEPGLYLPGQFGVRLEDCFHMTPAGPRWFSTPPPSIEQPLG